jgi:hypothetical protein
MASRALFASGGIRGVTCARARRVVVVVVVVVPVAAAIRPVPCL